MNRISNHFKTILLCEYFEELIQRKRELGNNSTADLYRATNNWLKLFSKGHNPMLREITPGFVDNFHTFLQSEGCLKVNSMVSYISNFRAMYNTAIREKIIHPRVHPFSHISLRKEKTVKRAVTKEVLENVCRLELQQEPDLRLSADLCVFSYLACGIPFVDLAHLTKENIVDGHIVYNRIKTGTPIRVCLTNGMLRLLNKYEGQNSTYLFPILINKAKTTHEEYKTTLRNYNSDLKEIGKRLDNPIYLTSYVIRHTWATEALKQHIPIAIISQTLGHTSEKTTRYYLDQLDQSELNKANFLVINSVDHIVERRT